MEITARFTSLGQATEGVNKQGNPWRKATATFETMEQYPKTIAIDFFNTQLDAVTKLKPGTTCTVKFDIASREYNGKWYTNLTGFAVEAAAQPTPQPTQNNFDQPLPPLLQEQDGKDDLPF